MDPYKVLGVSPNATEDEIKAAYKALAKKYHPDNYANNPLSDLALEKMKEINSAYDEAMNRLKNGTNGFNSAYGSNGSYSSGRTQFEQVRVDINAGRLDKADAILDGIALSGRNGEWNFLKGCICQKRGWYSEALNFFTKACNMEPNNAEFRAALNNARQASNTGRGYNPYASSYSHQYRSNDECTPCEVCQTLWCADTCCECMGGDLIRCC